MVQFFRKYHKWLGIVISLFILLFAFSGIVLNHRRMFAPYDVNRTHLPQEYKYTNWNNAAVKASLKINRDSILIYGNIGIWLTDSSFSEYSDFSTGFPEGMDNRKVSIVFRNHNHHLFAGTLFGLYHYEESGKYWEKMELPIKEEHIVDITEKGDTLLILSRSFLLRTLDLSNFELIPLPPPAAYDNKIGLFKTLWVIHSGEIWGLPGILVVDLVGIIFIFLSLTGLLYFILPAGKREKLKKSKSILKIISFSLKWHNKVGWITVILLFLTVSTGMFLRPPLLAVIAEARVGKIPHTELSDPNPWYDKLRAILFDADRQIYILATNEGVFHSLDASLRKIQKYEFQPPLSIMGVTAFCKFDSNSILLGSFEGLFVWNPDTGTIYDYIKKQPYQEKKDRGAPLGEFLVSGYSSDFPGGEVYFDFNKGAKLIASESDFSVMPEQISELPMSLWNFALEIHTARIYKFLFGDLYILFIPLAGLIIQFILISGFIVWYKKHR